MKTHFPLAWLLAGAVLAGCKPHAPAPEVAPVAAASQPAAPVSELASLRSYLGKYPHEDVSFLEQGVLAARLKALLGPRYPDLLANLRTVGPLSEQDGVLYITGNRPHEGGSEAAAVVIDPRQDALRVWLLSGGQASEFQDRGRSVDWPRDVRVMQENARAPG